MPQVQDRSLYHLICSPLRAHRATAALQCKQKKASDNISFTMVQRLITLDYNDMNVVVQHVPGAGSIALPVDLQYSTLPLCMAIQNTDK